MVDAPTRRAMIKATAIGEANTASVLVECSTDLPADALGEACAEALRKTWRAGDDPIKTTLVLTFS